jgi:hypothetical protein
MKVTMFWHGGSNYACFDTHNEADAEEFDSIESAKRAFAARSNDSYYPCVDECSPDDGGPEAWIFKGAAKDNIGAEYPDFTMSFGPRGGVRVARA